MRNGNAMPTNPDDLLSSTEVCGLYGLHRSTLSRWVQLGKLPARRLSEPRGPFLFRRSDVERLIKHAA